MKGDKTLNIVVSEGEPELNGADFAVELIPGSEAEATYSFPPWWGEAAVESFSEDILPTNDIGQAEIVQPTDVPPPEEQTP